MTEREDYADPDLPTKRPSPWIIGLIAAFGLILTVFVVFPLLVRFVAARMEWP